VSLLSNNGGLTFDAKNNMLILPKYVRQYLKLICHEGIFDHLKRDFKV